MKSFILFVLLLMFLCSPLLVWKFYGNLAGFIALILMCIISGIYVYGDRNVGR